jgi:hypothetical protein
MKTVELERVITRSPLWWTRCGWGYGPVARQTTWLPQVSCDWFYRASLISKKFSQWPSFKPHKNVGNENFKFDKDSDGIASVTPLFTIKSFVGRSVWTHMRICRHNGLLRQYLFVELEYLLPDYSGTLLTANCVKSSHSHYVSFKASLILSSQLLIQLPSCLFLSCLPVKITHVFITSFMLAT